LSTATRMLFQLQVLGLLARCAEDVYEMIDTCTRVVVFSDHAKAEGDPDCRSGAAGKNQDTSRARQAQREQYHGRDVAGVPEAQQGAKVNKKRPAAVLEHRNEPSPFNLQGG
jgi:hypothetical protein